MRDELTSWDRHQGKTRPEPDSLTLKTSTLKFEVEEYTSKNFNANDFHAILRRMPEPSDAAADAAEPSLEEQIAATSANSKTSTPRWSRSSPHSSASTGG